MPPLFDEKRRRTRAGLVAAVLIALISGCGQETVNVQDTIAPQITSTTPAPGATGVSLDATVAATFSKVMNPATINGAAFTVTGPEGVPITGTVTYTAVGSMAIFTPTVNFVPSTKYTATITTGAQDQAHPANPLAASYVWSFTTAAVVNTAPPSVVSTIPVNAATGVPVDQVVSLAFSEAMNAATISPATFTVTGPGKTAVMGNVTYTAQGSVAKFTPDTLLAYSTTYTATVTTGATNLAGNALANNYVWTFTTGAAPDTPPTVVSTLPINATTGVAINQGVSAIFSKSMNPQTITAASFELAAAGGALVAATVAYDPIHFIATLKPSALLAYSTTYTATITTGATDLAGNALANNFIWAFITAAAPDTTPPTVISTIPLSAATGVAINQVLSTTFSKAMNCATLATSFTVTGPGATAVAGTVNCTGAVATFTPATFLATNTLFTATITTAATDLAGNALASDFVWSFITVPAPTPPTVISTGPTNGATGVPINQALTATFSEAMNPATINAATFTVTGLGGAAVAGAVTYVAAGSVATFTPAANLASSTVYTATITNGAMDLASNPLASNFTWTFTTAAAPDTTPPTVIATVPVNTATNVAFNQTLSITFSEPMNPATIGSLTFTLAGPGATAVAGLVTYATIGNTATFTPAADLAPSTLFAATMTTGATDLAGNAMVSNYVWTFTTGSAPDTTPPTVVSTIPTSAATDVAVNQSVNATFSKAMNPLTITTATFQLTAPGGALIAATVAYDPISFIATLTPSTPLASSTTYTATITTGETDLTGNALAANYLWTFTTAAAPDTIPPTVISTIPLSDAPGVAINQVLSTTFSKAMNCATLVSPATTFTVTGPGATAVAGTVNCTGAVATFTPTALLATNTLFTATITTAARDLAGDALASDFVWSFMTVPAPTPPTVISTVPADGATGVPINQALTATFNEAMNPATINGATFTVTGPGGVAVAGAVRYLTAGSIATFTPSAVLAYSTTYTATITTGATDLAGNALANNFIWAFITAAAPDTTPPTVISTIPLSAATGVAINQVLSTTFSKAMNCATLATSFTVTGPGATVVAGTVNCTGAVATFTPATFLATNTLFTATITTAATDLAGNALASDFVWSFITVPAPTPPTVISTGPTNGATGVPINQALTATFSEAMNPATINAATFTVTGLGGAAVAGAVTYVAAGSVATFTPAANLASSTVYTATITNGAMDLASNPLASNFTWTFTTAAAPDTTPPTVIATVPVNTATNVAFNQTLSITFSEPMNPATIGSLTFTLAGPGGTAVAGLVTYATIGNTATFTPAAALAPSTLFAATMTTGATDLAGNAMVSNYVWTFTTGAAPDTTPPTVISTTPTSAATDVAVNQSVNATFSKAMNPLTITTATFQLAAPGGALIAATVAYDPISFIATLTPSAPLASGSTYTAMITTGETDLTGNALAANYLWTFTTAAIVIPPPVNLGTASLFGGLGGAAGMTNQGTSTVINGDIGTTGASSLMTGFHDSGPGCTYTETSLNIGAVNGAIDTSPPSPTVECSDEGTSITAGIAATAAADALSAYNALVALPGGLDVSTCPGCGAGSAGELGGRTLAPGIYKSAPGTYGITVGDLTLDAQGDPNAYWIFQMATTLTVGTPSAHQSVILVNGAQPQNVFWQVGSAATINGILGGGTMVGTIISQAAITISTAGVTAVTTINGRVLALAASVTMVNTVINVPVP